MDLQPLLYPEFHLICGPVKYFKLNPIDPRVVIPIKYSAFKKDVAFEFENEYRLLIATPQILFDKNPSSLELGITDKLLKNVEIICHPAMNDWQFKNISDLCQDIDFSNIRKSLIEIK